MFPRDSWDRLCMKATVTVIAKTICTTVEGDRSINALQILTHHYADTVINVAVMLRFYEASGWINSVFNDLRLQSFLKPGGDGLCEILAQISCGTVQYNELTATPVISSSASG